MTVKEIFELRKQGKIEEAYEAIRPMYAVHKGRYTSLCMFWTASDIFKKRLRDGHTDEASKIFEALKRVLPYIKDSDTNPDGDQIPSLGIDNPHNGTSDSAAAFMQYASRALSQARKLEQMAASKQEKPHASEANFRDFRNFATFRNPQDEKISAVFATQESEAPLPNEDSSNSQLSNSSNSPSKEENKDFSGHLAVSLDEGIIRPIKGLTAIQRVILACVVGHPGYTLAKISEGTGIPQPIVEQNINVLAGLRLVEYRDTKQSSGYYPL